MERVGANKSMLGHATRQIVYYRISYVK